MAKPSKDKARNALADTFGDEWSGSLRAPRTVDLMTNRLRENILAGSLEVGSLLPAERVLSTNFGVNRHTVRSALARLEAEGLIMVRQGDGARVLDYRLHGNLDLIVHLAEPLRDVRGILELRRAVFVEVVGLACDRAPQERMAALETLALSQEAERARSVFVERDLDFAREAIRAVDNLPMELLHNTIATYFRAHPEVAAMVFRDLDAIRPLYGLTISLVRGGDSQRARHEIHEHIAQVDQKTMERIEKR